MTEGFQHAIAGGQGNLVITSLQSPNFVHDVSGWQVDKSGNAEFNSLVIRGTFFGLDFIINSAGAFFYSGTPANGNLIASITSSIGTDSFGNAYQADITTYGSGGAFANLAGAALALLAATGDGVAQFATLGGGEIELTSGTTGSGDSAAAVTMASANANSGKRLVTLLADESQIPPTLFSSGDVTIQQNFIVTGNLTINGTNLTVNGTNIITALSGQPTTSTAAGAVAGTSATAGLTNGQIAGTSGAQSAGTAHTHGAGSYAVINGQHSHGPGSYDVSSGHVHDLPTI